MTDSLEAENNIPGGYYDLLLDIIFAYEQKLFTERPKLIERINKDLDEIRGIIERQVQTGEPARVYASELMQPVRRKHAEKPGLKALSVSKEIVDYLKHRGDIVRISVEDDHDKEMRTLTLKSGFSDSENPLKKDALFNFTLLNEGDFTKIFINEANSEPSYNRGLITEFNSFEDFEKLTAFGVLTDAVKTELTKGLIVEPKPEILPNAVIYGKNLQSPEV